MPCCYLPEACWSSDYAVDLIVANGDGPLKHLVPDEIRIIDLNCSRVLKAIPSLTKYLLRHKPKALYSTIVHANIVAALAATLSRTDTKVILRESNVPSNFPRSSISSKAVAVLWPYIYSLADSIISVSEGVAEDLVAGNRKLTDKIEVLPTPVMREQDLEKTKERADHPWLSDGGPPVILGVGRLAEQKDFATLIRAFAEVLKKTEARLLILGEGKKRAELELLVKALKLEGKVSLPGFVKNPFPYFARCAVFALSSKFEGMPNVLIQAMACSTPAVATDCHSGPAEVTRNGELAALVPVGDPKKLAEAIVDAFSSPRRADAADYVLSRFGVRSATEGYLSMLK